MTRETKAQMIDRIRAEEREAIKAEVMDSLRAEYAASIKTTRTRADKPSGGVTRYSRPSIWHGADNQPTLAVDVSRKLADALTADRQLYAKYHRIFKANGKEHADAIAAKAAFDTNHSNYIAECKVLNVLPGGY